MMQEKTFYLENSATNTSQLKKWVIPTYGSLVNLQPLLQTIPDHNRKIFKIYDPQINSYIPFNSNSPFSSQYIVARQYLKLSILMIKYTDNPAFQTHKHHEESSQNQDEDDNNSVEEHNDVENRKERSRERNIREVIEVVQKWRSYHDNPIDGKRKTLQQAASLVGVSKKSLDDYYYQLRVGEKYDFDFQAHLEEKIGVLRAFIKQKDPQRRVQGKNSKHPKKLKIIEQFAQKLRITDSNSEQNSQKPTKIILSQKQEQPPSPQPSNQISQINFSYIYNQPNSASIQYQQQSNVDQIFWGTPFHQLSQQKYQDCQKKYYDDFGFNLEDLGDPYLEFLPFNNLGSDREDKGEHEQ